MNNERSIRPTIPTISIYAIFATIDLLNQGHKWGKVYIRAMGVLVGKAALNASIGSIIRFTDVSQGDSGYGLGSDQLLPSILGDGENQLEILAVA